ncbi:conserved protein, unknown function [Hepatocystis sp. ex Piliocolobus tephrosceles]|nr:conserved protein, unknown function [Hepatocystis sp. ex Piliocolobus tephrosceles]
MKLDKKKEFKKKLVNYCSLLQAPEPLKIIVDESFINLCITFKISFKDELNKLMNRQITIMTTKCIQQCAKKKELDESAYSLRKITYFKCNHNENNLENSVNTFLENMTKRKNNHTSFYENFFENKIKVTHDFDNIKHIKLPIPVNNKKSIIQDKNIKTVGNINKSEAEIEQKEVDEDNNDQEKTEQELIEENNEKQENETNLTDSIKCIIDLVKNNNENKFFIATNNRQLRLFLRDIFIVPIIYVNDSGVIKLENISTKNMNKKEKFEMKKFKMPKWERELKLNEQRKKKEKVNKSLKKKKKKKYFN